MGFKPSLLALAVGALSALNVACATTGDQAP